MLNAVFALNIVEELNQKGWKLTEKTLRTGLQSVYWPARFQIWRRRPLVILDAAHNPSGIQTLVQTLRVLLPGRKVNFLFGVMGDKDYLQILRRLAPVAEKITCVSPKTERAVPVSQLVGITNELGLKYGTAVSVKSGFRQMLKECTEDEVLCVTGSHYVIGELLG